MLNNYSDNEEILRKMSLEDHSLRFADVSPFDHLLQHPRSKVKHNRISNSASTRLWPILCRGLAAIIWTVSFIFLPEGQGTDEFLL